MMKTPIYWGEPATDQIAYRPILVDQKSCGLSRQNPYWIKMMHRVSISLVIKSVIYF